jgi:CHAT domain
MPSTPLILLTFADDADVQHLPLLKKESDELWATLVPLEKKQYIRLHRSESTTVENFLDMLQSDGDDLTILHYAGHAGGESLNFEGGEAHAKGLAGLLGKLPNLQLVFLNGCSTAGQVALLQKAGVQAVIATSCPIGDEQAAYFSSQFYRFLVQKRTIEQSFTMASDALSLKYRQTPFMATTRGAWWENLQTETEPEDNKTLPWRLYLTDAEGKAGQYRLPYHVEFAFSNTMTQHIDANASIKVNQNVVKLTLESMCRYNMDIYSQLVQTVNGQEMPIDSSTYFNVVVKNLPWMIGKQLHLLRQFSALDEQRLEHLISAYVVTSRVLYYIMVANLWKENRNGFLKIPPDFLAKNTIDRSNLITFNYIERIMELVDYFETNNVALFVPEFRDFCKKIKENDNYFAELVQVMDKTAMGYPNVGDVKILCESLEIALAHFLKNTAFLAAYKFTMVRNIGVYNPLYGDIAYDLNIGSLNATEFAEPVYYEDTLYKRKKGFTNRNSVVLLHNENEVEDGLNLSPFIIDLNTYLTHLNNNKPIANVFMYAFEDKGAYYYHAIIHSLHIAMADRLGTDLRHTEMTQNDFEEGRNINKATTRHFSALPMLAGVGTNSNQADKILAELKSLNQMFWNDVQPV